MFIVVDTNIIYSVLLSKGEKFSVFFLNSILNKFQFAAPEFIFFEIGKHFEDIIGRSKLTKEELSEVFSFLKSQIEIVPFSDFNSYASEAEKLSPHEKDVQYFALSLALNKAPIWSDEKAFLKQNEIEIFNKDKLLEEIKKSFSSSQRQV